MQHLLDCLPVKNNKAKRLQQYAQKTEVGLVRGAVLKALYTGPGQGKAHPRAYNIKGERYQTCRRIGDLNIHFGTKSMFKHRPKDKHCKTKITHCYKLHVT